MEQVISFLFHYMFLSMSNKTLFSSFFHQLILHQQGFLLRMCIIEREKKKRLFLFLSLSADSLLVNTFKDKTDMRYGQILGACTHTQWKRKKKKRISAWWHKNQQNKLTLFCIFSFSSCYLLGFLSPVVISRKKSKKGVYPLLLLCLFTSCSTYKRCLFPVCSHNYNNNDNKWPIQFRYRLIWRQRDIER